MLIAERLEHTKLSNAEKVAADFILSQKKNLRGLTTRQIAAMGYTTPSTLVRLGQHMGYHGWKDFLEAFLDEVDYLERYFQNVNANKPFESNDDTKTIANKIAALCQESIEDTMEMLNYEEIEKAVDLMEQSVNIYIVALSISLDCCRLFKSEMMRIGKAVIMETNHGEQLNSLILSTPQDCAIVVSYSGSSTRVVQEAQALYSRNVPIILITGRGENPVNPLASHIINITTRERLYSKIAGFSSQQSIHLILSILYSCYYARNYETNWKKRIEIAQYGDFNRRATSEIMKER
ncbi:HTH-type transcriptional regulator MurR [Clostridiales bacterium CHKCI001]|nr:HTH-type transcriptional regulator MurR [Clostridiales bacterium CHKCI001]